MGKPLMRALGKKCPKCGQRMAKRHWDRKLKKNRSPHLCRDCYDKLHSKTSPNSDFSNEKEHNMGDKVTATPSPKDASHPSHHPNIMFNFKFHSQALK